MALLSKLDPWGLPLRERAALVDELSIYEIAVLDCPGYDKTARFDRAKEQQRKALETALLDACKAGELSYYGDINGWRVVGKDNPYPRTEPHDRPHLAGSAEFTGYWIGPMNYTYPGSSVLIQKADFRCWLEAKGLPLPVWWFPPDDAEPPAPAGPDSSDKPAIRPRKPLRNSDPATVIDAALDALEQQNGRTPEFSEVWPWLLAGRDATGIVATVEGRELVLYSNQRMTRERARKVYNRRFR